MVLPMEERRRNMQMFECLGARRVKLARDRCGYVKFGELYPAFRGHENFANETLWAQHYPGPQYSRNLREMMRVESQLYMVGLHGVYAARLVPLVYPRWEQLSSGEEVWAFWFRVAHAAVETRFEALWQMQAQLREVPYERQSLTEFYPTPRDSDVLARAIELAPPDDSSADVRTQIESAFREFVEELTPYEAIVLFAQMYVGRGDFERPDDALEELGKQYQSNAVIANEMLSKGTLLRNLKEAQRRTPKGGW